jgi:deazaflavin-dependent oxidoreductase (nitroreductase family)
MAGQDDLELTMANLDEVTQELRADAGPGDARKTNAFNSALITEFRATGGKLSGDFEGGRILLLTTTGRKTGQNRTTPLAYVRVNERIFVIASMGGAPKNPAWYGNLVAHPEVTVEMRGESYAARALVMTGDERDSLFTEAARKIPQFAEYQKSTTRAIPIVELQRLT